MSIDQNKVDWANIFKIREHVGMLLRAAQGEPGDPIAPAIIGGVCDVGQMTLDALPPHLEPERRIALAALIEQTMEDRLAADAEAGMDIRTQLELAILSDFFGPAARLARLAGLTEVDVGARFDDLKLEQSIAERLQPAHRRARALLQLVAERHGVSLADEAIAEAMAQVRQCVKEMEAWGR